LRDRCTLSGFGDYDLETFRLCGIPVIDLLTTDYGKLCEQVVRGPMIPIGARDHQRLGNGALDYQELMIVARRRQEIAATIYNLPNLRATGERLECSDKMQRAG
jgi:hypothetical protein